MWAGLRQAVRVHSRLSIGPTARPGLAVGTSKNGKIKTMVIVGSPRIRTFKYVLEKLLTFSISFSSKIKDLQKEEDHNALEYAYVEHFESEVQGLLRLTLYLLEDNFNSKYVFFAVRASFEALLYLEYVFQLAEDDKNEVLILLSKDVAQMSASSDRSLLKYGIGNSFQKILEQYDLANKVAGTGFDLRQVDAKTNPFPSIYNLCLKSKINIKDFQKENLYNIYALYSESAHLRLGGQHSIGDDPLITTGYALEYFVEIFVKFYQLIIDTSGFYSESGEELEDIKNEIGLSW